MRALAIASESTNAGLAAGLNAYLGAVHHARGDHRQALVVLGTARASFQDEELRQRFGLAFRPFVVWCYTGQAWSCAELGDFTEAIALGDEGVRIAEEADHPHSLIVGLSGPGFVHLRLGSLHTAIANLERAVGLCQGREVPLYLPWLTAFLGYAYALSERLHEAVPLLEQAIEQAASAGIMADQSLRYVLLAEAYLMAGRTEHATTTAGCALELSRRHEERGIEAWSLRLFGEIGRRGERLEAADAEHSYLAARALAQEIGMRPLVAHCHLGLGALYGKIGNDRHAPRYSGVGVTGTSRRP